MTAAPALLDIHGLRQSFPRADGGEHLVLDGVELALQQPEVGEDFRSYLQGLRI